MFYNSSTDTFYVGRVTAAIVAVVLAFITAIVVLNGFDSTDGGQYLVVRASSPHANKVTKVLQPGSGLQWVGVFSESHKYPANQRNWTFTLKHDKNGKLAGDAESPILPTANGVPVGAEGTLYFTLCSDPNCLKSFDTRFGTRTFNGKHPYDEGGFPIFFTQQVEPVIVNDLRRELANVPCEDLNASCALIQNQGQAKNVSTSQGQQSNVKIQQVQDSINSSLPDDIKTQLGGDYLTGIHFIFRGADLSPELTTKVNVALGAFADISQSQAHVRQAQLEAQANAEKQKGYNACQACATQDIYKSIPGNITVWAPGSGSSIAVPGK